MKSRPEGGEKRLRRLTPGVPLYCPPGYWLPGAARCGVFAGARQTGIRPPVGRFLARGPGRCPDKRVHPMTVSGSSGERGGSLGRNVFTRPRPFAEVRLRVLDDGSCHYRMRAKICQSRIGRSKAATARAISTRSRPSAGMTWIMRPQARNTCAAMPRPTPANIWTVKPMAASCRLYSGTALPSGIHCKRSRASHERGGR
jgi:hypothetical protein